MSSSLKIRVQFDDCPYVPMMIDDLVKIGYAPDEDSPKFDWIHDIASESITIEFDLVQKTARIVHRSEERL